MAKASADTTDAPKKAPRKRAVRRVVNKSDTPVRRTRVVERESTVSSTETVSARKAPTKMSVAEKGNFSSKKTVMVVASMLVVFGGAAWIGFSDAGQIDVNAQILEANQRTAVATESTNDDNSTEQGNVEVPVQNTNNPISVEGLRGRGVGTPLVESSEPVPEEVATTSATSTEGVTEEGVSEDSSVESPSSESSEDGSVPVTEVE